MNRLTYYFLLSIYENYKLFVDVFYILTCWTRFNVVAVYDNKSLYRSHYYCKPCLSDFGVF
jgi:hypothetical protein